MYLCNIIKRERKARIQTLLIKREGPPGAVGPLDNIIPQKTLQTIMARNEITFLVNLRKNEVTDSKYYGQYYPEAESKEPLSLKGFARHMVSHGRTGHLLPHHRGQAVGERGAGRAEPG